MKGERIREGSDRQSQAQTSGERLRVGSERGRGLGKAVTGTDLRGEA